MIISKVDRLKFVVKYAINEHIATNQKELGQKLGYNNESAFSQVINGKVKIPKDFIEKLKNLMPDLNEDWIETGNGEMIGEPVVQDSAPDMLAIIDRLTKQIEILVAQNKALTEELMKKNKKNHATFTDSI